MFNSRYLFILFLLFFLSFIIFPFPLSPYEKPKILTAEIVIQMLVIITIYKGLKKFTKKLDKHFLIVSSIILLISVLHLLFLRSLTAFWGNAIRLQGIFLLWHLIVFSLVSSGFKFDKIPKFFPLMSTIAILIFALVLNRDLNNRAVGTLGEPNSLAAMAIFIWPFLYTLKFSRKMREIFAKTSALLFVIIIILLSNSRSGFVALSIQLIFLANITLFKMSYVKASIISIFFLGTSLILPFLAKATALENRAEIWQIAVKAGFDKPIFGYGFGNLETAISDFSQSFNYNNVRYQYVDSSHNFILDWWLQAGVIGLLVIFYLTLKSVSNFALFKENRNLLAFLGVITVLSFNPASVVSLIHFWWLIGQGFARHQRSD
ncbi:hypothetical protein A2165_02800 [Candidatus Curtissbacteria bacterium RBG_13_40_7]|uniref:O-antigen ligase-related domain-containing protein n=1 Tax=Candidatus Curtissbacteria bacterium RBG_13_40_7 TaxID=1797706 RepID=A0A1F5FWK5_9BACT|nr:MAG: hypothetical protein A2165_02800 [Candidatus Curtissbacteria bacterium RBG_13_40_7]